MIFRKITLNPNHAVLCFVFAFLTTLLSFVQAQTVHVVDNNEGSGAAFTSAQAAVDNATAGDIIYLQPSPNSYGNISMNKQLTIYGLGHRPGLNAGAYAYVNDVNFSGNASGSKLSGLLINRVFLTFGGVTNHDVVLKDNRISEIRGNSNTSLANNLIVTGNFFYTNTGSAIDTYNSQNWVITHNTFHRESTYFDYQLFYRFNGSIVFNNNIILSPQIGNGSNVVRLFRNSSGTQINNCIFLFRGTNVANFNTGDSVVYNNCLTYSVNTTLDALAGSNNIDNQDPQFTSFDITGYLNNTNFDYTIQSGSPAKSAGNDGNDLGVENGTYPFSIRGYPTELPYITEFTIYNTTITAGTPLNINIKANANITD
ncbi:right-handed parallel beta-helix repeat-containing protein [Psychroserpens sp. MEBiC05023]